MKTEYRTYGNAIRVLRGKRKNDQLVELAEAQRDFEYRRLLIEERELDLFVYYSRATVSNWISWALIFLSIFFFQYSVMFISLFIISLSFQLVKYFWNRKLQNTFQKYIFSLKLVDGVIKNDYGISLS
jgi:hypothetical protein